MGPKKIKRALYAGQGIPAQASNPHVFEVMVSLLERLQGELQKEYRWMASCTVAVMAGTWGGDRRRKRREKLLTLVNLCRAHLELEAINPPKGWSNHNLFYGYGAIHAYGAAKNVSLESIMLEQVYDMIKKLQTEGG